MMILLRKKKWSRRKPAPDIGYSTEVFIKNLIYGFDINIKRRMIIILAAELQVSLFTIFINYFVPKMFAFDVCNFIKQIL